VSETLRDTDSGLLNEAYFRAALPNRVATARRTLRPTSIAVLDVDGESGTVAQVLLDLLRESDTACQLENGQYVLVLEDTPEDGAVWIVERIRRVLGEHSPAVPTWAGVASYPAHALEAEELLTLAGTALTTARQSVTPRVEVADS
jgi:GGDEF domain-containing protein